MRLTELVNALADHVSPRIVSAHEIETSAFQARLIAWNAMLGAVQVDISGKGLHDAAKEIAGMAEMVSAHTDTVHDSVQECLACLEQFQSLFAAEPEAPEPLWDQISLLRARIEKVGLRMATAIESLPNSMSRDVSDVSIDRIQIECLLKQSLVNARDRLRASALALNALDDAVRKEGVSDLEAVDTDRLIASVRHRLAVLSRDSNLGDAIRRQDAG